MLLLVLTAFILTVFSLLGRTDLMDLSLADSQDQRFGWRYELLTDGQVQDYEPVFDSSGYLLLLPEGTSAVRISRTMTEDIPRAELEWIHYLAGVEVYMDGEMLYSDFGLAQRSGDSFLRPTQEDWDRITREQGDVWRRVRMSLPADYLGRELSMTTYFTGGPGDSQPEYPSLGSEDSPFASLIVFSVRFNAVMTVYALLALAMAGVFLLDIYNDHMDGKTLLLCLYFLMLFLDAAYHSDAGCYSVLRKYVALEPFNILYMTPLYLYLVLRMRTRWKWPLCAVILAWTLYVSVRAFLDIRQKPAGTAFTIGPGALAIFLAVAAALCAEGLRYGKRTRQDRRLLVNYGLIAALVTAAYLFGRARAWGSLGRYLADGVWTTLCMGNFEPVVTLGTNIVSYMTAIVVVSEVVRRTIQAHRTVGVLRERSRWAMESYERLLAAGNATNAANHEMRHHMTALAGILQDGDLSRAREYVASVSSELDRLPVMRYSPNILVNAIAGAYLDQAKALGIRVDCSLNVPAELNIADEDISVFLTNMLENALHACQRLDPGQNRYIRLKMAAHENFLFIGCANSAPAEQEASGPDMEEKAIQQHGYGLEAMRQIAEKYNSMLLLERTGGEFSVKSNFNLRSAKTAPSAGPHG